MSLGIYGIVEIDTHAACHDAPRNSGSHPALAVISAHFDFQRLEGDPRRRLAGVVPPLARLPQSVHTRAITHNAAIELFLSLPPFC